ncbi:hypothetical protein [Burkholderia pseudomallei]|uniref:hypothetical protein n=1 Tax=Burkholderia pseudomallei TaxID=28450 RepID=UPI00351C9D61
MNLPLSYPSGQPKPPGQVNERNGASGKTVIADRGPVRVEAPPRSRRRLRADPDSQARRRFTGFDERI